MKTDSLQHPVQRVLVIRIGHLGDSVMATTAIEPLRHACGADIRVDFASGPGAAAAVLRLDRRIHRVFPIEHRRLPWWVNSTKRELRSHAHESPYDLVINLECGPECDDFARFLSYRQFCGRPFADPRHLLSTHCVDTEKSVYRDLLGVAATESAEPQIKLSGADKAGNRPAEPVVLLNPGFADMAKNDYRGHRRWPTRHWLELIDRITATTGLSVVVNGTEPERPLLEPLLQRSGARSLVGARLERLVEALRSAACAVSVDTGTMHLAAALGTPVVALFGPTIPALTGPYSRTVPCTVLTSGIDCQPCDRTPLQKRCPLNRCMTELGPERVFTAVQALLTS
jgi:ADP-heptose:LPS heptosyltransferase